MDVSGHLHTLATLPPRKESPVPIRYDNWVGTTGLEVVQKKFLASAQDQTMVIQPIATPLLAQLSQLILFGKISL
jgi:hypothetical protein